MKEIIEIKRLWKLGLANRAISRALNIHRNTVNKYVDQFKNENLISNVVVKKLDSWVDVIDWEKIRIEYLRGVSLNVIHEELLESNTINIQYAGFWKQLNKKISLTEATMVRIFKPGDRTEIDYADGVEILDPVTGEIRKTQFFVGVLCNSRYTFAEFSWTQSSRDFLQSHVNMFEYFGGVTHVISPDNLKSAVAKAHRYDPVINQAYSRLADYYEVVVVPARVRTPKDKAIVERTIQIFQRYFFMKIRNRTFTSLLELNICLREHLEIFNNKMHRIFKRTRLEMFTEEKKSLRPLPMDTYKVATYARALLSRDCHLIYEQNYYSAPHILRGRELDIWATEKAVEIFFEGDRVAFHARSKGIRKHITDNNHYPEAHQAYAEEDVQKIIQKATAIGIETEKLIKSLLESPQPLKYFRRCQGIIALSWKYSVSHLESACRVANLFNNTSIKYLERVIETHQGEVQKTEIEIQERSYNPFLRGLENIH